MINYLFGEGADSSHEHNININIGSNQNVPPAGGAVLPPLSSGVLSPPAPAPGLTFPKKSSNINLNFI